MTENDSQKVPQRGAVPPEHVPLSGAKDGSHSRAHAAHKSSKPQKQGPVEESARQAAINQAMPVTSSSVFLIELPPDYVTMSWMSCFFCCCPLSTFAILYSYKSRDSAAAGDFEKAKHQGELARKFALTASVIGFIILLSVAVGMWTR